MRFGLLCLLVSAGCTIHAVNPHPSVTVSGGGNLGFKVDASGIPDHQKIRGTLFTSVGEIGKSLENGMANAAGDRYAPKSPNSVLLRFTSLSFALDSAIGGFISARFRARWIAPNGERIAEVSGVAKPNNPFETNQARHLEDVLDVMYEKIVDGYDRATHPASAPPSAPAL